MINNLSKSNFSKIALIILIAVLAFLGWMLVFGSENFTSSSKTMPNKTMPSKTMPSKTMPSKTMPPRTVENSTRVPTLITTKKPEPIVIDRTPVPTLIPSDMNKPENFTNHGSLSQKKSSPATLINYETFAEGVEENPQVIDDSNISGKYASAPSGSNAAVNYDDDVNIIPVEGTDLLAAPLADRMYYTNSIANVNRNASQDFRGDIPISYNASYTPFYQSAIYGEPMTINRLGDN